MSIFRAFLTFLDGSNKKRGKKSRLRQNFAGGMRIEAEGGGGGGGGMWLSESENLNSLVVSDKNYIRRSCVPEVFDKTCQC